MGQVKAYYQAQCAARGLPARRHTQVWHMLRRLRDEGHLHLALNKPGDGVQGHTTLVHVPPRAPTEPRGVTA